MTSNHNFNIQTFLCVGILLALDMKTAVRAVLLQDLRLVSEQNELTVALWDVLKCTEETNFTSIIDKSLLNFIQVGPCYFCAGQYLFISGNNSVMLVLSSITF